MNTRGAITLVFDDGYKDVYDEVIPLLAYYGVQAVFAVPLSPVSGKIEHEEIETVNNWKIIAKKYGHEIAAHGMSHRSFASLSHHELEEELAKSAQELQATTLVYPGGAYNEHIVREAQKHYTAARTVKFGLEQLPPEKPFELKTINYTKNNFSRMKANSYSLLAWIQNKWLIETFHMVRKDKSSMKHTVSLSDLDAHLDFITSLPIRIATTREIVSPYAK